MTVTILVGDVREKLRTLAGDSIHCVVTSPPYWGLRDYGVDGQIGLEASPAEFIATMVAVFEEVRRVLRPDGTCWINMGDSYAGSWGNYGGHNRGKGNGQREIKTGSGVPNPAYDGLEKWRPPSSQKQNGLKPKDLVMMPHRMAIALQDAGWWVRQDIVWSKPNPMPESVRDRCTKAHEYIFLLTKSAQYFYDAEAIKEPVVGDPDASRNRFDTKDYEVPGQKPQKRVSRSGNLELKPGSARGCPENTGSNVCGSVPWEGSTRNKRSVWTISTKSFTEAHFATFPPELPETCIKAGCPIGGTVLDPFFGAGTTGLVADRLQRDCIGIELNPAYAEIARKRIYGESTLLSDVQVAA